MGAELVFSDYLKPELAMLIPVLYTAMQIFRRLHLTEKALTAVVTVLSLTLCALRVFSTCEVCAANQALAAVFTSVTQGLIVSGAVIFGDYHLTKPK